MKRVTIKLAAGSLASGATAQNQQLKQRSARRSQVLFAATAAALSSVALVQTPARAATVTWAGTIADPNSATYTTSVAGFTSGQNLYQWNTTVANWTGAATTYSPGNDVVFTDNFSGGKVITVPSGNMNPTSVTFSHVAGSTASDYFFLRGASGSQDFSTSTGGNVQSNSPWQTYSGTIAATLTLDTGFLGHVYLRSRANSSGVATATGNTIIRSGILEVNDALPLPNTNNQNQPAITIAGGEFWVNINTAGNTNPASGNLAGTLTVTGTTGILANAASNSGRLYNGAINVAAGAVLTIESCIAGNFRADLSSNLTGTGNVGTIRLADRNGFFTQLALTAANAQSTGAIFDLGSDSSELVSTQGTATISLGALTGTSATALLSGSTTASTVTTYSLGARGNADITYAGKIRDGSGTSAQTAITKVGSGIQTLSGQLIHTGDTNVNAGTLALAGDAQMPNVNANNGGTVSITGASGSVSGNPGILLNANQGGTIKLDNSVSNNDDRIGSTTPIHLKGGSFVFVGQAATNEATGDLAVDQLTGNVAASGTGGTITFSTLNRSTKTTVNFDLAAGVNLNFNTAPTLTNGIIGGFATVNSTQNWATLTGNTVTAFTGYTAAADDAALAAAADTANIDITSASALNVPATRSLNSLKLSGGGGVTIASGQTLTLSTGGVLVPTGTSPTIGGSGSITAGTTAGSELFFLLPSASTTLTVNARITDNPGGAVGVVKSGPGALTLSNTSNSFTGGLSVLAGSLKLGGPNNIGGDLTIDNGTTVDVAGFNQTIGALHLINGTFASTGGPATVTGTSFDVRSGTVTPALAGTGALTKTTGSTVTLNGANSYSGGTTVNAGTLNATAALNSLGSGALTVTGGTLNIGGLAQNVTAVQVTGGTIGSTAGGSITGTSFDMQAGTVNAVLGGAGANLTKTGTAGTTVLGSANTYTGTTTVSGGILQVAVMANGGSASGVGASSSAAANLILDGGTFTYSGAATNTDRLFTINQNSSLFSSGSGPINFNNAAGTITDNVNFTIGGTQTGTNTLAMKITGGGFLTKASGGGQWILANTANDYNGFTTINAGTLSVTKLGTIGQPSSIGTADNGGNKLILAGGTLQYIGSATDTTDRLFSLNSNSTIAAGAGAGSLNFANTAGISGGGLGVTLTLTALNLNVNTFAGQITGGSTGLTKAGSGTWTLTNNGSDYTGITTIGNGTLLIANLTDGGIASPIGAATNAAANLVLSGGTLKYTGPTVSTNRNFTLSGTSTIDSSGSGVLTFSNTGAMGGGATTMTLTGTNDGVLAMSIGGGATHINKTGTGTWTLTGALTYTGTTSAATTVSAGKLLLSTNQLSGLTTTVTGGTLELAEGGGSNRILRSPALTVTGTGRINIQDNKLITNTAVGTLGTGNTYTGVTGLIQSGRNGGGWGGNGIVTSQTQATSSNFTSIGLATAQQVKALATASDTAVWAGQTVTGSQTLVMYTYGGDANLDGKLNVDDYGRIDFNVALGTNGWYNGDFNYDGKINVDDYGIIDFNIGIQGAAFPTGAGIASGGDGLGGVTAVPEPATLSLLGLAAAGLVGHRRRRRQPA